jgi:hypothetical protein
VDGLQEESATGSAERVAFQRNLNRLAVVAISETRSSSEKSTFSSPLIFRVFQHYLREAVGSMSS